MWRARFYCLDPQSEEIGVDSIGKNNNNVQTMANKVIMLDLSWFDVK